MVSGIGGIAKAIKKYDIERVILADNTMPKDVRKTIRDICIEQNVEVQDFAGFYKESYGAISLYNLMEYTKGRVELVIDDKRQSFDNGDQAVMSVTGKYLVKSVSASENMMVVELQRDIVVPNNLEEEWVQNYEKETGEEISFF